jgi:hypothetical protein
MNSSNRKMSRLKIPNHMKWGFVGLLLLIVAVATAWKLNLRRLICHETTSKSQAPLLTEKGEVGDHDAAIHEKLREEYEKRLQSELAIELEKLKAKGLDHEEPTPPSFIFEKPMGIVSDITNLSNGIPLRTEVVYGDGDIALAEMQSHDSYTATYQLKLRIPRPATSIAEIEKATPGLRKILPGFESLFPLGFVSPWHQRLYQNKISHIRNHSKQLGELLSKPNVYDCNTILHLRSAKGRKVLFMQADLDATLKGADGDRLAQIPAAQIESMHYDPFTAYHWKKISNRPNPMIAGWERRIAIGRKELEEPKLSAERKLWVEERIAMLQAGITAMKQRSYLISAYDPYIILPLSMLKDAKDPYSPKIGDYALVIHGSRIYPCIVGDKGSDINIGEASARLAMQLNSDWRDGNKAVKLPVVSYLVFPESRDTDTSVPNYGKWKQKCLMLLNEIGGLGSGIELHQWTDPFPKTESVRPK